MRKLPPFWGKVFVLSVLLLFCIGVGKTWHWVRKGFRVDRCALGAFHWPAQEPSLEEKRLLSRPFRFLGAGRQCYAFESEEGKYILKLPRTDIYRTVPWKTESDRPFRKARFSKSVEFALTLLQGETGLKAYRFSQPVTLIDPLGRAHQWGHSRAVWLIQPKMPLLFEEARSLLKAGDRKGAEKRARAFGELLASLQKKKIICKDMGFEGNVGYEGEKAFFIDIGTFMPEEAWPHSMISHFDSEWKELMGDTVR